MSPRQIRISATNFWNEYHYFSIIVMLGRLSFTLAASVGVQTVLSQSTYRNGSTRMLPYKQNKIMIANKPPSRATSIPNSRARFNQTFRMVQRSIRARSCRAFRKHVRFLSICTRFQMDWREHRILGFRRSFTVLVQWSCTPRFRFGRYKSPGTGKILFGLRTGSSAKRWMARV